MDPFIGAEAMRDGRLTRGQLRWNHTLVHPGVYLPNDAERTLYQNTVAAWLWTGRKGVIDGRAAAALHGAKWIDATRMDGGAQSPGETRLRLWLIDAGLSRPRTQIRVSDGFSEAFIDMGYDEPMVGLDYEGSHHSENRGQYVYDIGRADLIDREGWIDIRVIKEHSRRYVVHRVREAFARRGWTPPKPA